MHAGDVCEFCQEFSTGNSPVMDALRREGVASRVIVQGLSSLVIAGLGPIAPGYVLLVPLAHRLCLGHHEVSELEEVISLASTARDRIEAAFGEAVFFEHGSVSPDSCAGSCVPHAHLHAWPRQGVDYRGYLQASFDEREVSSMQDLRAIAADGIPYIYFEDGDERRFVYTTDRAIPSQFIRREWARARGCPNEYDWALFPKIENMVQTIESLK